MIVVVVKNGVVWEAFSDDDEEILVIDRDVAREKGTLSGWFEGCKPIAKLPLDIKMLVRKMGVLLSKKENKP